MTMITTIAEAPDLTADDYIVVGVATCFFRDDDGVHQVKVIEPIPSSALEALIKGIPTSYEIAAATTLGALIADELPQIPASFPTDCQLGSEFAYRCIASARTYKRRTEAQVHIPQGETYSSFNYSTERKRILNADRVVTKDDNVKQHAYTHQKL
ncbi:MULTISPECIES: hypothetical protein [unclassified Chamaesiphon]|uniref:hypothetical protein n=1 Tax=unclassified Chamaesiphon TaxID=2620921 RepID=UPI00286AB0A4|nr:MULTISPECIES: hypothetical protein [unclassified Chamaesiphon]